jgi:Na+/H+ antiporter NhaC
MRKILNVLILLFITVRAISQPEFSVEKPEVIIESVPTEVTLHFDEFPASDKIVINGSEYKINTNKKNVVVEHKFSSNDEQLSVQSGSKTKTSPVNPISLWLSIVPPLLAIVMALIFREVLTSLFLGIFTGTAIIGYHSDGLSGIGSGFLSIFDEYVIGALNSWDHLAVILFSMTIGAVVTVISKNGGMQGVVNRISKKAKTAKGGQLATYMLGISIFFDDYANTLVVGNTMRAVTDKLKISREKLAYLVDSTAAPIAAVAFVTTWIGAELGYIQDGVNTIPQLNEGAYSIFLNSLSFSFYPIFTLAFVLMLILFQRDYGPMLKAENKARKTGEVLSESSSMETSELEEFERKEGIPMRPVNAIIPVLIIVLGTIIGLFYTGWDSEIWQDESLGFTRKLSYIIGQSDSYTSLLWSSLTGLVVAILMTIAQRLLTLQEVMDSVVGGYKSMITAMMILTLAWSLAQITQDMHTAAFLKQLWSPELSPVFIPAITFLLAALVAFSTGSSWGTMAILYPLLLPATYQIAASAGFEHGEIMPLFYNVVSCILAGSVLGDHCSPISDTTILSSLSADCHHIDHVRTQLPYALSVGGVAIFFGTLPAAFGIPSWILFPVGIGILVLIVRYFGKSSA